MSAGIAGDYLFFIIIIQFVIEVMWFPLAHQLSHCDYKVFLSPNSRSGAFGWGGEPGSTRRLGSRGSQGKAPPVFGDQAPTTLALGEKKVV
jgi:hypothetical protein